MDRINKLIENNDKTENIKIHDDPFTSFPEVCNWISSTKIGSDERTEVNV
jgi:hypothetical protein